MFGLGYVGSVSAACFASMGHRVTGVDVSRAKVGMLESGRTPIVEGRMEDMVDAAAKSGLLRATTDPTDAVLGSEISFICVGTPSLRNGKLDLSHITNVGKEIGAALKRKQAHHTVVLRSTVLPGTTESVLLPILERESGKHAGVDFNLCYNPEFMREGSAVADFLQPPYTILGSRDPEQLGPVRDVYKSTPGTKFETTIRVAEMAKYLSNAFHAVKVAFANEMGTLGEHLGVDIDKVTTIFTSDTRLNISAAYLTPGFAFGGSCLPKDIRALMYCAKELDVKLPLLESVLPSNSEHLHRAFDTVVRTGKRKVAQLGLSFKAGTDDLRESPQVELIKRLLGEGFQVRVWDQDVSLGRLAGSNRQYIEQVIPHIGGLLKEDLIEVISQAEVIIIGNKSIDRDWLACHLRPTQTIIDLVNLDKSQWGHTTAYSEQPAEASMTNVAAVWG